MVEQKELTQVTCEDAAGQTTEFMLGRVLPGQRNGSQLRHESFSTLLKAELGFAEWEAYPCLLVEVRWMQMFVTRGRRPVHQQQRLHGVCLAASLEVQIQDLVRKG